MDWDGIKTLLQRANEHFPRLNHLWVEAGYRGEDKGKDWALRRPWAGVWMSSSAQAILHLRKCSWHELKAEWRKEDVIVDWEKLLPAKGFVILPRRWVVERSFGWISHNRRMSLGTTRGYVRAARRSRICCHDSPHDEAIDPPVRPFHTVSPRTLVNKALWPRLSRSTRLAKRQG
jgi:transposase